MANEPHAAHPSLEFIINAVEWADKQVQKQYTKLGQHIPDKYYNYVVCALSIGSVYAPGHISIYAPEGIDGTHGIVLSKLMLLSLPDYSLSFNNLVDGKNPKTIKTIITEEATVADPDSDTEYNPYKIIINNALTQIVKFVRLPVLALGLGYLVDSIYSELSSRYYGGQISSDTALGLQLSLGYLALASSMYLKDQDPKLLNKEPNKIITFLQSVYSRINSALDAPLPIPQAPQPAPETALQSN